MSIKAKEAARRKRQNEKLRKMYESERQRVAGHEQLASIQSAYITILLNKLGATKERPVAITKEEVTEALAKDIVRVGCADAGVFNFYIEEENK